MRPNRNSLQAVLSLLLALQPMAPARAADETANNKEPVAPKHAYLEDACIDVWVGTPKVAGYGIGDSIPVTIVFDVPTYADCQKRHAPDEVKVLPSPAAPASAAQAAAVPAAPASSAAPAPDIAKVVLPTMLPVPQIGLDSVVMAPESGNLSATASDVEPLAANLPEEYDLPGQASPPRQQTGLFNGLAQWFHHLFSTHKKGPSVQGPPNLVLPPAPVNGKRIVEKLWVTTYVTTQRVGDKPGQTETKTDDKPDEKPRPSKHQASFTVDFTYAFAMQPDGVQFDWRTASTPELTVGIHRSADENQTKLEEGDLSPKVSPIVPAAYWLTYWSWPLALPMVASLLFLGLRLVRRERKLTKSEKKIALIDKIVAAAGGTPSRKELRLIYGLLRKDLRILSMTTTAAERWLKSEERKKRYPNEVLDEQAIELVFSQEALSFDPDRPDLTSEESDALLAAIKVLIRR